METPEEVKTGKPVELYVVRIFPPCRVVWLYLMQHNIPHVIIDVDLTKSTCDLPDPIRGLPHLEVPILIDGDLVLFEASDVNSWIFRQRYMHPSILNHLARTYTGHTGYGIGPTTQALTDSIISWANSELHRCIGYQYVYPQFLDNYSLPDQSANETLIEAGLRVVSGHLERLETRYLRQTPYMCGQRVTIADMFVATILVQLEWTGFNFNLWPKVTTWLTRVKHVDFWDDVHLGHEEFLKELKEKKYRFD